MSEDHRGEPRPVKHPIIRRAFSVFLAGLATVIPIVGTVWLLYIIFKVLLVVGASGSGNTVLILIQATTAAEAEQGANVIETVAEL